MGYVYKITNTVNNKSYIGISIHEPEKKRIKQHLSGNGNRLIANAVKKYGKDAFTYEILEENIFDEFLPDLEVAYIANHNTVAPNGYNLNSGGNYVVHSQVSRQKISKALKDRERTQEHCLNISKALKGRKLSADHCHKISESNKGKNNFFYGKKQR